MGLVALTVAALAVPDALPWPEAGGFPEVFSTAFDALFTQGQLRMGERVLVRGADVDAGGSQHTRVVFQSPSAGQGVNKDSPITLKFGQ